MKTLRNIKKTVHDLIAHHPLPWSRDGGWYKDADGGLVGTTDSSRVRDFVFDCPLMMLQLIGENEILRQKITDLEEAVNELA